MAEKKETKSKIEDVIPEYLVGEIQKAALEFVAYLKGNKFSPRLSTNNTETWKVIYKSKCICTIHFCKPWKWIQEMKENATWVVEPHLLYFHEYEDLIMSEGLQKIIWDGIIFCNGCPPSKGGRRDKNRSCIGGQCATVLGKELKGICANVPLTRVCDPNETEIGGIKRILELEQRAKDKETKKAK